jgi:peptidyl-dipeptidase A
LTLPDAEKLIERMVEELKPLEKAYALAEWASAVNGTPEANAANQAAQAAYMRFLADPERFAALKRVNAAGHADPLVARQVKVLYLLAGQYQQDEAAIEQLTTLEAGIRDQYYNFRGEVDGKRVSDNELDEILSQSGDTELAQEAWEASKLIGVQVASQVRQVARVRNEAARRQGHRDHFQRSLEMSEIEEPYLLDVFARLEAATEAPFAALKAEIDAARAAHFGLPTSALQPWHFGDRFFQDTPPMGEVDLDSVFADKDPVQLALTTFDGLGLEVRDVLDRSDLYERPGKNQHAFCTNIDREGDIRTLNNLLPNHNWNATLLHELGHAVYDKYQNRGLPWLLRGYPHIFETEAIAHLMGSLASNGEWLATVAGVAPAEADRVAKAARRNERASDLIFTRWVLVMTHFERGLYANPEADLDTLWWDLVERYQGLRRPAGRAAPDWAAKIHVALYPVYYHNYELGHLLRAQLEHALKQAAGGLVGKPAAGQWLRERFFAPGNTQDWRQHIEGATGEGLNPDYFVRGLEN